MKMKRISIPVKLIEKAEKIATDLQKIDFLEIGFLNEPNKNDVIRMALLLGLEKLENMIDGIDIPEKEHLTERKPKQVKNKEEVKKQITEIKEDFKKLLGDFGE